MVSFFHSLVTSNCKCVLFCVLNQDLHFTVVDCLVWKAVVRWNTAFKFINGSLKWSNDKVSPSARHSPSLSSYIFLLVHFFFFSFTFLSCFPSFYKKFKKMATLGVKDFGGKVALHSNVPDIFWIRNETSTNIFLISHSLSMMITINN